MPSCVEALAQGAWEYLPKPFSAGHLQIVIGRAVRALLAAREARGELAEIAHQYGHGDRMALLGKAAVFRRAMEVARKVAPTDASVLITGESGTGKELIARFIHEHSKRATHPFVAINCAAVPEGLLESEMFGHRKGAFSGADHEKVGLFEAAHRGTLFLDELAEMPRAMQTKLLRVIQDGVVRRVGSETTDAIVNVRFVAATNRDLEVAVATGQLREDLYYRLCVVPIHVPPLRARSVDIPVLAEYFLTAYWVRHRSAGTPRPTLTWEAIEALRRHPWRGNVRELQNVIEHTAVLVEPGAAIGPAELPLSGETQSVSPANETECVTTERARSPTPRTMDAAYRETLDSFVTLCEREYVLRLLHANAGNVSRAARAAGVDRTTLYRIMQRLGVQRNGEGAAAERTTEGLSRRGGTSIPNAPRPVVRASVGQAMHSAARS